MSTNNRPAIHALIARENHDTAHAVAGSLGVTVTALVEAVIESDWFAKLPISGPIANRAREIDADRRSRSRAARRSDR